MSLLLSLTGSGQTSRLRVTGNITQACRLSANSSKCSIGKCTMAHFLLVSTGGYKVYQLISLSPVGSLTDVYKTDVSILKWMYFIGSGLSVEDVFY